MKKILLLTLLSIFCVVVDAGEEIKLTLVDRDVVWDYTPSTGDWYFGAYDETGMYTVHLDYITERDGKYGTYTYADLDTYYSYIHYVSEEYSEYFLIKDGSEFTLTKHDKEFTISGRLICSDGNTYVIEGRFKLPDPKTIDVECQYITYMNYFEEDKEWYLRFKNNDYKVTLDLISPDGQFSGTYTEADAFSKNSCFITDMAEDEDISFVTFTVTMQQSPEVDTPQKGCEITGTGITVDGDIYNFHVIKHPPIKPKEVVTLDMVTTFAEWPCHKLSDGSYYELTEKNNPNAKWTLACYRLMGEMNESDIDTAKTVRYNALTGKTLKLNNGKITQTLDASARNVIVKAELVMSDSVQYNFSFLNPISVNDSLSFTFEDLWVDTSLAENGSITLSASNENCNMFFNLSNAQIPGSYDNSNAYVSLSIVDDEGGTSYVNSLAIIRAECTIAEDGSPVLDCRFIGSDMNIYAINASLVVPEITDSVHIQFTNASFYDSTNDSGDFTISAYTEDYNFGCNFIVMSGDKIAGHYNADQLRDASFVSLVDEEDCQRTLHFYSGDFDVSFYNDVVTLTGRFHAGNYYVTMIVTTGNVIPTNITDVATETRKTDVSQRYNIVGQPVGSNYKGLVIMNGRKYTP